MTLVYRTFLVVFSASFGCCLFCKQNEYLNLGTGKCLPCTVCPDNVFTIPCFETRDTTCGLIGNFSFLEVPVREAADVKAELGSPTVLPSNEDETYWKTLAFALIAVLSLLVVITSLMVFVTCHRFRNYSWLCKGVTQDQAEDTESGGYVIIHRLPQSVSGTSPDSADEDSPEATHPFVTYQPRNSRFGAYKPKRRLMNEYVDDVFESDDSTGSRIPRPPLAPIMEKSESPVSTHSPNT